MTNNDDSNDRPIASSRARRPAISKSGGDTRRKDCSLRSIDRNDYLVATTLHELAKVNAHLKNLRVAAWLIIWLLIDLAAQLS